MPNDTADNPDHKRMTLGEHLEELRWRLIYALVGLAVAMGVSLVFGRQLIWLLQRPYLRVVGGERAAVMGIWDAFATYLRVSLMAGVVLASPWIFYQVWAFVAAGLYPREKKYIRWAVPFCAALFVGGVAFFLFVVAEPILAFFMGFASWIKAVRIIQLDNLITFMTRMMLVFGLAFQTPIVVLLLEKMGIVTTATLARYRRHVIVGILILAAFMTSPSPVDQIAMAVPMWLLYELGILLAWLTKRPTATQR